MLHGLQIFTHLASQSHDYVGRSIIKRHENRDQFGTLKTCQSQKQTTCLETLQNGNAWKIDKLVATLNLENKAITEAWEFGLREWNCDFPQAHFTKSVLLTVVF